MNELIGSMMGTWTESIAFRALASAGAMLATWVAWHYIQVVYKRNKGLVNVAGLLGVGVGVWCLI